MIGTSLAHYDVLEQIGSGGMGDVYRARDKKLDRDVAIKILPEAFSSDPDRVSRFEREARVLASLNHPNIAAIYGFEKEEDVRFLVLELVPGETLAQRGALALEEALPLLRQIASALKAAHDRGIVHRDLKPANIKVTPEGDVKVLDFGLAKAFAFSGSDELSDSPTRTKNTAAGVILGTAPYMSPEQARGKPVDKRSDLWSFGCVVYEVLAGSRLFDGETVSDVLAAILKNEPDWSRLPADTPAALRRLLRRCLVKDPNARLSDAGDAKLELDDVADVEPSLPVPKRGRDPLWLVASALLTGIVTWVVAASYFSDPLPTVRYRVRLPDGQRLPVLTGSLPLALSPTGDLIACTAESEGVSRLYVRALDSLDAQLLTGTEDATSPFFSPDGQWIGFEAGGKLKKVSVSGGAPFVISDVIPQLAGGATWTVDDTIIIGSIVVGLRQVPASGGTLVPLTEVDRQNVETHRWPRMIPGGEHVLFTSSGGGESSLAVLSLRSGDWNTIEGLGSVGHARYLSTGHLIYAQGDTLMAVGFNPARAEVRGTPVPVIEGVRTSAINTAYFAVSSGGDLLYVPGSSESELGWVHRDRRFETIEKAGGIFSSPRLAPDGTRVLASLTPLYVWIIDLERKARRRISEDPGNIFPLWSPDGRRVSYTSLNDGQILWRLADASEPPEPFVSGERIYAT